MKACTTAGGGVMFIPDDIERETKSVSYKDFIEQEAQDKTPGLFGKKQSAKKPSSAKAA